MPASIYYKTDSHTWDLPLWEEKPLEEYSKYLFYTFQLESMRYDADEVFKNQFNEFTQIQEQEVQAKRDKLQEERLQKRLALNRQHYKDKKEQEKINKGN